MVLRVFIPCSMIFLVEFKHYMYFVVPIAVAAQTATIMLTQEIYGDNLACGKILENYEFKNSLTRDLTLIVFITIGIYSHNYTLVTRFIKTEHAQLQQRMLTQVFVGQPDGLIVLKKCQQDANLDQNQADEENRQLERTPVQLIEDSIQKLREDEKIIRYEVKFQNTAAEKIFGSVDI